MGTASGHGDRSDHPVARSTLSHASLICSCGLDAGCRGVFVDELRIGGRVRASGGWVVGLEGRVRPG
jgi:hypothetical protein